MPSYTVYVTLNNLQSARTVRTEVNGTGPLTSDDAISIIKLSSDISRLDSYSPLAEVSTLSIYIKPDTEPTTDA